MKLEKESEDLCNPDDFAKYGKIQRKVSKMKKDIKPVEEAAKESQKRAMI